MTSLETKNYHIPQFAEEDVTSWGDYNSAMDIIDSTMKDNSELAKQGINDASAAMNTATAAESKANTASLKADTANANVLEAQDLATQANNIATAARGVAEAAEQKAQEALDASGGSDASIQEAIEKAENAATVANTANGNAAKALEKAAEATSTAQDALSQATHAGNSASAAIERAENALNASTQAQNTANTALEKAEEALAGGGSSPSDPELNNRVKTLETEMSSVKNSTATNAGSITSLTERVEELETTAEANANDIQTINTSVSPIVEDFPSLKQTVEDNSLKIADLETASINYIKLENVLGASSMAYNEAYDNTNITTINSPVIQTDRLIYTPTVGLQYGTIGFKLNASLTSVYGFAFRFTFANPIETTYTSYYGSCCLYFQYSGNILPGYYYLVQGSITFFFKTYHAFSYSGSNKELAIYI